MTPWPIGRWTGIRVPQWKGGQMIGLWIRRLSENAQRFSMLGVWLPYYSDHHGYQLC
jgi:hypothetical protein